ncbi:hypothetical protein SAMN02910456_02505 [Ruminococcaceae bacterium YRB3002]|nr:hypothetical protein SAMN02910456_02505 [Ruminococcaceae bacterium YRB3002]
MMNSNGIPNNRIDQTNDNEPGITKEESFSYDGYQVVRGEFFAHLFEPSVTFKDEKVSVNAACLNKLPNVDFVQFLVNPQEKKLAVKPCTEEMKDSFCWSSSSGQNKRKPKMISCKIFFAKVMNLMGWDPEHRYKILGKLIRTKTDTLFVFDLTCAETYIKKGSKTASRERKAFYPEEWKNQFGVPVKDHQDLTLVSIFDDYTVFKIDRTEEREGINKDDSNYISRHEETSHSDTQTDIEDDE